jgi:hypothetical protein
MTFTTITRTKLSFLLLSSALLLACQQAPSNDVLNSKSRSSSTYVEGVPGGAFSQVEKIHASVSAIDYVTRAVTLKDDQGNQRTVIAAPDVANLEQVKVGDRVNITVAVETVVYLRERGQAAQDGAAAMVMSGAGTEVGVIRAANEQVTALVIAVDLAQHKVTLQYPDGSHKTFPVRQDVALSPDAVGREVVIDVTQAMAIRVAK